MQKNSLTPKCYSFRSTTKNNEVIVEKPFPNSGVTRRAFGPLAILNTSVY